MNKRLTNRFMQITLSVVLCIVATTADARPAQFRVAQAPADQSQARLISADRAAAIARQSTGGRVLSVNLTRGNRPVYRVKVLLNSKRVRTVVIDARSGSIR